MNIVWPVKSSAPAMTTSVSAMPKVAPITSFWNSGGVWLPMLKIRIMPMPTYAPASMLATKNPSGDSRMAAILRSASLVKASMVSAYMDGIGSLEVGCGSGDDVAYDDERRRSEAGALYELRKRPEGGKHRTFARPSGLLDCARGRGGSEAAGQ